MATSDHLFALVGQMLEGQISAVEVNSAASHLLPEVSAALEQHRSETVGNPELPADTAAELGQALETYLEALQGLAEIGDTTELKALAEEAFEARTLIRALRQAQQQRLQQGPALTPYLNRMLLHLQAPPSSEPRHTLRLLQEFAPFRQSLQPRLLQLPAESRAAAESALNDLQEECGLWSSKLTAGQAAEEGFNEAFSEEVMRVSEALFAELVKQTNQLLLEGHDTDVPWVNLVLTTAEELLKGGTTAAALRSATEFCRRGLNEKLDSVYAESLLAEPIAQVESALNQLDAVAEDREAVRRELPSLKAAAGNLALFLDDMQQEAKESLNMVDSSGLEAPASDSGPGLNLPLSFSSLLALGDAWCSGSVESAEMEQGLEIMEGLVRREQSANVPPNRKALHDLFLQKLDEGLGIMMELLRDQDRFQLEKATQVYIEAGDLLKRLNAPG